MLFPKRHSLVLQPWWWLRRGRLAGQRGLGGWRRGGGDGGRGGRGRRVGYDSPCPPALRLLFQNAPISLSVRTELARSERAEQTRKPIKCSVNVAL